MTPIHKYSFFIYLLKHLINYVGGWFSTKHLSPAAICSMCICFHYSIEAIKKKGKMPFFAVVQLKKKKKTTRKGWVYSRFCRQLSVNNCLTTLKSYLCLAVTHCQSLQKGYCRHEDERCFQHCFSSVELFMDRLPPQNLWELVETHLDWKA